MDVRNDRQTAAPVKCQEQGTWEEVMGNQGMVVSGVLQCSKDEGRWGCWDLPKTPGDAIKTEGGADEE